MSIQITFQIDLSADYHVASGHGRGTNVDSSLLREWDSTPVIRGTELVGLLREGFINLCATPAASVRPALSSGCAEMRLRLFGDERHPKKWYFSSAVPTKRSNVHEYRMWGSQDTTRVQINPRMRRTDPQKLFIEEEGDRRIQFQFTAACPTSSERDAADAAALVAAARMVRAIGSSRRRGRGACTITVVNVQGLGSLTDDKTWTEKLLTEFKQKWIDPEIEQRYPGPDPDVKEKHITGNGAPPVRLRVLLYLQEPTLIARRSEAANVFETLNYIPGGTLLGSIANDAAAYLGFEDGKADQYFTQLFVRGGIQVSNLLPAKLTGSELHFSVPASKAVLECELYPETHPPVLMLEEPAPDRCPACTAKLEQHKGSLVQYDEQKQHWVKHVPQFRDEMHIRMNEETGRVETGNLFDYNCLEAGQIFAGQITCENLGAWKALQELLAQSEKDTQGRLFFDLRLGKASRRGYGGARIMLEEVKDDVRSPIDTLPMEERVRDIGLPIDIMLLSDAIVIDPWGRFYSGFSKAWLAKALCLRTDDLEIVRQFASTREVDSFNGHRRMPRWRDIAIEAGSTVRIRLKDSAWTALGGSTDEEKLKALRERLQALEHSGIGLRRPEGFGSVVFNHPSLYADSQQQMNGIPEGFLPNYAIHPLVTENDFIHQWQGEIEEQHKDRKAAWNAIRAHGEVIARLIYLSRNAALDEVLRRIEQLHKGSRNLFGDEVVHGEKQEKISEDVVVTMVSVLEGLKDYPEQYHTLGLKMLSETIAREADRSEEG